MLYGIDSHTFIWSVKKQADDHDRYRLEEGKRLMQWFDAAKHQILVPTVVLAECLIKEPEDLHAQIVAAAHKRFIVGDFDSRCALKYGELLRLEKWDAAQELRKANGIRREKMKIDHMVVCCALVHGAKAIFSDDPDVKTFAEGLITIHSPSIIPKQTEMFESFSA